MICLFALWPLLASAAPVDPEAFGMITTGMSEQEVLQRLGEPDQIEETARQVSGRQSTHRRFQGIPVIQRTTWRYAGTAQTPPTVIEFAHGKVTGKGQGQ